MTDKEDSCEFADFAGGDWDIGDCVTDTHQVRVATQAGIRDLDACSRCWQAAADQAGQNSWILDYEGSDSWTETGCTCEGDCPYDEDDAGCSICGATECHGCPECGGCNQSGSVEAYGGWTNPPHGLCGQCILVTADD